MEPSVVPLAFSEDGARVVRGLAGPFELLDVRYAPAAAYPAMDFDVSYVAVVLEGGVRKGFASTTWDVEAGSVLTMPAGALHTSRFAARVASRVLLVRAREWPYATSVSGSPRRHAAAGVVALGWRIVAELRACDTAWSLAAEGLTLELLAAVVRRAEERPPRRPPRWLVEAEALLREEPAPALAELARLISVDRAHLARTFRTYHGVSVGEYVRRRRLERAAATLSSSDLPLAIVAADAGFADQSHFTRAFRAYAGVTPGRFRARARM